MSPDKSKISENAAKIDLMLSILERHDDKFNLIRHDMTDLKTRMGIKDVSNGKVQKLFDDEVKERKKKDDKLEGKIEELSENQAKNNKWVIGLVVTIGIFAFGVLIDIITNLH